MSISDRIAVGVATGVTEFLKSRSEAATEALEELARLHDDLHFKAGELAGHQTRRYLIERDALTALLGQDNPVSLKPYTKTDAEKNLDLFPAFAQWRLTRNELEGEVHFLESKIDVARRLCDLQIALVQIVAKEA